MFKFSPNQLAYPEKKLTIDEILAKFIKEGIREHEEIKIFIREFRTTNELLLKMDNYIDENYRIEEELTWVKTFGKEVEEYVTKKMPPRRATGEDENPPDIATLLAQQLQKPLPV
ncbi:hypothetical protein Tco_0789560 [Tanacetum coccineum]